MKKTTTFIILLQLIFAGIQVLATPPCKVKLEAISGEYIGDCIDGLAHGQGKAIGTDSYEGDFEEGLPHGKGVYTWADGSVYSGHFRRGLQHGRGTFTFIEDDEVQSYEGMWRNGELRRTIEAPAYTLGHILNVDRYTIRRLSDGEKVLLILYESGRRSRAYRNLLFHISSGGSTTVGEAIGYEMVDFPATVQITYTVPDKLGQGLEVRVRFEAVFNEPGIWEIRLYN
jgi:hypothetical protein